MKNTIRTEQTPKRGDIYYANLQYQGTHQQTGRRPVIVIQNDIGNRFSPTTIVIPLTSKRKKRYQPTHVLIEANETNGLSMDSIALLEQIQTISKDWLDSKIGTVDCSILNTALEISVGLA